MTGTLFIAGAFSGLGPTAGIGNASDPLTQRSHLVRIPSGLAVRIAGSSGGCVLDLRSGSYLRRTALPGGGTAEQRWYAHRTIKGLLVMYLSVTAAVTTRLSLTVENPFGSQGPAGA